jgi:hypothetical protein
MEPAPPEEVKESDDIVEIDPLSVGYRIDGVRKMTEDIVGPNSTEEQRRQVYEGAVLVHEKNKLNAAKDPVESHQETIDESYTRRGVESFLRQKAVEKSVVRPPVNYVTCDSIADEAEKKKTTIEEEIKVKETVKNNVTVPVSPRAPVDKDLLKRERKYATSRPSWEQRDQMMRRYRENMEREKAKWMEQMLFRPSSDPYK